MKIALDELILYLFGKNPYLDFNSENQHFDAGGWHSNVDVISEILREKKPLLSIEVGSYKGASALMIAEIVQAQNSGGKLICIDTWLGSLEHLPMANSVAEAQLCAENLLSINGYPNLYRQFLFNVLYKGLESVIIPFPNTSITAYKWLKRLGLRADFIYVDGSHEPEEVWLDLKNYFRLLTPGGLLLGDDYKWPGVQSAVQRFCKENKLPFSLLGNNELYLLIKKN